MPDAPLSLGLRRDGFTQLLSFVIAGVSQEQQQLLEPQMMLLGFPHLFLFLSLFPLTVKAISTAQTCRQDSEPDSAFSKNPDLNAVAHAECPPRCRI